MQPGREIVITEDPKHGLLELAGVRVRYVPDANFAGQDQAEILVCERSGVCATKDLFIEVIPRNDPPSAAELVFLTKEGAPSLWQRPAVSDPDEGELFTTSILSAPEYLQLQTDGPSVQALTKPGWSGLAEFRYRVCDGNRACVDAIGIVEVVAAVYAPENRRIEFERGGRGRAFSSEPMLDLIDRTPPPPGASIVVSAAGARCTLLVNDRPIPAGAVQRIGGAFEQDGVVRIRIGVSRDCKAWGWIADLRVSSSEPYVPDQIYPVWVSAPGGEEADAETDGPLTISGFDETVLGARVRQEAWAPRGASAVSWWLKRPGDAYVLGGHGSQVEFVADRQGAWELKAVAGSSSEPKGKIEARKTLHVRWPRIESLRIVEAGTGRRGRVRRFQPEISVAAPTRRPVSYLWTLPDGTQQTGNTVEMPANAGAGILRLEATLKGTPITGQAELELDRQDYRWPSWSLYVHDKPSVLPADVGISVLPDTDGFQREHAKDLQFHYELDPGSGVVAHQYRNHATLRFETLGEQRIAVKIRDGRGNRAELLEKINIGEGHPPSLAIRVETGDAWSRVPARIAVHAQLQGMAPEEGPVEYRFLVDGDEVYRGPQNAVSEVGIEQPGHHLVEVRATTTLGRSVVGEASLDLFDANAPACRIRVYGDLRRSLEAAAECETQVGALRDIRWSYSLAEAPRRFIPIEGGGWKIGFTQAVLGRGVHAIRLEVRDDQNIASRAVWQRP